ncbi:DUF7344 domain-containing protein [Halorussus halobius]|uniref:DUF7344 domain-containing protein n=1 Tax=Halorussus halobius TaxID=1710537 RepID=UPI001B2FFA6E|nr:hypothetical protein [Halorussus halobius]
MTTTDSTFDAGSDARLHGSGCESRSDAVFDALASDRCRQLLDCLADAEDGLSVDALVSRLPGDDGRVRARLHHTYLPKLADVGLVAYDADRELVRPGPDAAFEPVRAAVAAADPPVELDVLFGVLSDARRRRALRTLLAHGDLSLPDLADEVAVAERGRSLPEIDPDAVLDVYLSLYHTHVPKLTSAGLASYDQEGDLVAATDAGRALEATVRRLCEAVGE